VVIELSKETPYFSAMIKSKLTSKAQTTVPRAVRAALKLKGGDEIAYRIEGEVVTLTRAESGAVDEAFSAFHEWWGENDTKAYADL
jgi:antitoxin PrlF